MTAATSSDDLARFALAYREAVANGNAPRGAPIGVNRRSALMVAALKLGITNNQKNSRIRRLDVEMPGWDQGGDLTKPAKKVIQDQAPPEQTHQERRELLSLREELGRTKRMLKELDAGQLALDKILEMVGYIRSERQPTPDWMLRSQSGTEDEAPGIPVFHWCDWHIGETVTPDEVYHRNEFNQDVADERVRTLVERSLYLAFEQMLKPKYDGAVIVFGGDSVSGQLHEELLATDWCPPTVAAGWVISRKAWAIRQMLRAFGRLVIVCVPGNHGRLSRKPWAKRSATACFDHLIYAALREMFDGEDRITWVIPPDGEALIQIAGTRFLVMHGHELGVKGGDGIIGSLGPIARGAMKVGSSERSVGRDFDILLLSHFHQELWLPSKGIIVGGTLKGYDEYSRRERYRFNPASQLMFFVNRKFGPNMPLSIFLQEPQGQKPFDFVGIPALAEAG